MTYYNHAIKSNLHQFIFLSQDINPLEIKNNFVSKGISGENVEIITDIKNAPFIMKNQNWWFAEEVFYNYLNRNDINEYHKIDNERFYNLFKRLINTNEFNEYTSIHKLSNNERKMKKKMVTFFNCNETLKKNHIKEYSDIPFEYFDKYNNIFKLMDKIFQYFAINNSFDLTKHYIFCIDNLLDVITISIILRNIQQFIDKNISKRFFSV